MLDAIVMPLCENIQIKSKARPATLHKRRGAVHKEIRKQGRAVRKATRRKRWHPELGTDAVASSLPG